jgi:2-dehydro-3-deoxy-D-gluconate 5-dehydrogenase
MTAQAMPLNELLNLTGKTAIVTGGAMGIGAAIACRLAEAGAAVVIADKNGEQADKTAQELTSKGYQAISLHCDVSSENEIRQMVQAAVAKTGAIDILVNNAGIFPIIPLTETTAEAFERVTAVNLKGTFLCSREVSQQMLQQNRGGCIINIASIDALHPSAAGLAAYDASKGGVLALTRSMALELGEHGIRVNAIAPGGIVTEGMKSQIGGLPGQELKRLKQFLARSALGRMGRPDEIACVALFLASELASYITGSLVVADGGYLVS